MLEKLTFFHLTAFESSHVADNNAPRIVILIVRCSVFPKLKGGVELQTWPAVPSLFHLMVGIEPVHSLTHGDMSTVEPVKVVEEALLSIAGVL